MLHIPISPEDLSAIHRDRFYHPQPHIMMRMHTLALHHAGESAARIAVLLHRNPKTIRAGLHAYRNGGLQAVFQYQRNDWVRWHAALLDIELIFLPSYSPNLNLMERYWKFVKKKGLYNRFHGNFKTFCQAIDECVKGNEKIAEELKTLMTLKFQTRENVQFLAV